MTPLQIKMMLHYYTSPEPYSARDTAHAFSEATRGQKQELIEAGMLNTKDVCNTSGYEVTEKGKVYIEYLLSVPVPSIKYVIDFPLSF